ncbi:Cytosine deaminase [Crocosphaera watsonii WH 8502]|uniref:Cytosine deaminase n=1 Tax=Crocosphaera watsonii WH 8502 TaxID=423474 RepID=T2I900_CROWT|nr:Cytosine deaminase [Crocosphaera watsonii WH 8502]
MEFGVRSSEFGVRSSEFGVRRVGGSLIFVESDRNTIILLTTTVKISGDNCPQVLTLMPDDDPYQALRNVAGALVPGSLPTYQCNDPNNCPPIEDFSISVEDQL